MTRPPEEEWKTAQPAWVEWQGSGGQTQRKGQRGLQLRQSAGLATSAPVERKPRARRLPAERALKEHLAVPSHRACSRSAGLGLWTGSRERLHPVAEESGLHDADTLWLFVENCAQHTELGFPFEGATTCDHLVEHATEAEDVGARIGLSALQDFGRHVLERAHDRSFFRQGRSGRAEGSQAHRWGRRRERA